ncbi:MAG: hybrid sensor histidine kinase/response regulator [Chloroflexi bacterium]|nr:hybrid sensor histidine kinase/response regulator [Chloroflexota bacterium]
MSKARILIVEDELNLLEGVKAVLELNGYDVLASQDGQQALERLHTATPPPDLILSDIMMPNMDGLELLEAVRQQPEWVRIPFIFLTALGERGDIQRGKQLGVDDYLVKPFDADDLLVFVEARLKRQQALNEAGESAFEDLKKRIMTILNHEFRTPLTFVVAYADMLNDPNNQPLSDAEMVTFLKGVGSGAARLRRLVENFIMLVELETGEAHRNYEVRRMPIEDIDTIFCNAIRDVFIEGEVEHQCTRWIEDGLPVFTADSEYLRIALVQLLDNAVKFSPADKPVVLGAKAEDDTIHIWVSDGGRGIPPGHLDAIWESFYQIDRATHEDQGAGSGLPLVRGVVNLHGGRVHVSSEVGKGSTFTLSLPIKPPTPAH